jgi:biotin transport system permease protein
MLDGFGIYRPRRTPLHALPVWAKCLGLASAAVAVFLVRDPVWTLVALVASLVILVSALPSPHPTLRGLFPVALLAAFVGAYQWWRGDGSAAPELAADFLTLACLALAVTASTRLDDAAAFIGKAALPLKKVVPPDSVGLVFALTIRAIPEATTILSESRDAARARGLSRRPRATLVPAAVRTFGWALRVGEAITARGLADGSPTAGGETQPGGDGNVEYPRRRTG